MNEKPQEVARAHALSVEEQIGDISPMPPPLTRLATVEQKGTRSNSRTSIDSNRSVLSSTWSTSAASPWTVANGFGSREGTLTIGADSLTGIGGTGGFSVKGGAAEREEEEDQKSRSGGDGAESSVLSMAEEAALFWEVRSTVAYSWKGGRKDSCRLFLTRIVLILCCNTSHEETTVGRGEEEQSVSNAESVTVVNRNDGRCTPNLLLSRRPSNLFGISRHISCVQAEHAA